MRTEQDVRTNPIAGDVVVQDGNFYRHVRSRVDNFVCYGFSPYRKVAESQAAQSRTITVERWRKAHTDATVLNIAEVPNV